MQGLSPRRLFLLTSNWHVFLSPKSHSSRLIQNSSVVFMFCDLKMLGFFFFIIIGALK